MITTEWAIVARVADEGQWFEPGIRVECSGSASEGRGERLVTAVLGGYEVLSCSRERADSKNWLLVRLRRFGL